MINEPPARQETAVCSARNIQSPGYRKTLGKSVEEPNVSHHRPIAAMQQSFVHGRTIVFALVRDIVR
jgi:hypothetical protein